MKKLFLIATMAALAMNMVLWGQTITVTSPATGNTWCLGNAQTITWTKSGAMMATVTIRLKLASAPDADPVLVIINGTANDGSFPWTIPASVAPGDYFIRVKTDDSAVVGDSGIFHITSCSATSITVTNPNGTTWNKGTTHAITWTKSGPMLDTVMIRLKLSSNPTGDAVLGITDSTTNNGSYSWPIPDSVASGDYFIRIKTLDSAVVGDSVSFHIGAQVTIDPGILEKLKRRRYWEIKWPPDPGPCLCPEWDIRDLRELLGDKFGGSIVLLKNGVKLQELGNFGRGKILPGSVKANLSRKNFDLLKNGGAKFSIAILDGNGSILNESELQGGQQLLR